MLQWVHQVGTIPPPARRSSGGRRFRPCRKGGCPANHARPPGSPSNSSKIFPSPTVTFSPTANSHKSFSRNTYGPPRKYCKQKAYGRVKPFRCNTYKKQGGGVLPFGIPIFEHLDGE